MGEEDGDADEMAYDGSGRGADDAPAEPLDEHDVEEQVRGIVDDHRCGYQLRLTVDTHHRGESPHEDEGRITDQQHLHVVACQRQDLFVVAQQTGGVIRKEDATEDGQQHPDAHTQRQGQ